ncbi:unnamed protein product [Pedinophyceae sp. YPF-701]|nr:unnamed protein product [Pedinophyceae sp. YPF-701]
MAGPALASGLPRLMGSLTGAARRFTNKPNGGSAAAVDSASPSAPHTDLSTPGASNPAAAGVAPGWARPPVAPARPGAFKTFSGFSASATGNAPVSQHIRSMKSTPPDRRSPMPSEATSAAHAPEAPQHVDVSRYIHDTYTPYDGDGSFLAGATAGTLKQYEIVSRLLAEEIKRGGLLEVDEQTPSNVCSHRPGYIDKESEVIVGLQTDKPFRRAIKPFGGWRTVDSALKAFGKELPAHLRQIFTELRKTHNDGVFQAYTPEMRKCRKAGILTGLPDGYGRGRIIGDYRRVALYGVDALVAQKKSDLQNVLIGVMDEPTIQLREEVHEQIKALEDLKKMAAEYGDDISRPAANAREAVQWTYYAYLGAVKQQDGAAMSFGRVDAFLDTYIERDIAAGAITEEQAQEMIDQLILKLRIVRHLRSPDYNALFSGDPTWVTMALGGTAEDGRHMVTRTTYRILQTLHNLGPAPEPNITVLWHKALPENFKRFCAKSSIDTSCIQYENDGAMTGFFGNDYGISCCVSAMSVGKDMQFFGARCNLPKLLLYAINQGRDEVTGVQVGPKLAPCAEEGKPLDYETVRARFEEYMEWLSGVYVNTMNCIHYMHDKYSYESVQMALHDTHVRRFLAMGAAGVSVVADSLSAIKHAKVYPIKDPETGLFVDYKVEGDFPCYGNDNQTVDGLAQWAVSTFYDKLAQHKTYREAIPTLSVLTITSNVVYGKKTGNTPDGRKKGEPFAPGANPLHGRDTTGALASLNSVASLPYEKCLDGISNTFTLVPAVLGKEEATRESILTSILDGYFEKGGHHINVNVLNREMLMDAMDHPEKYPNLTIRVSGYAVHFAKLTREQQMEVISRTFHESI